MRLKKLTFTLLTFAFFLQSHDSIATHLVCGNINYKFVESTHSTISYEIIIEMYRDCYNSNTPFDRFIQLGVYNTDGLKTIYGIIDMALVKEEIVEMEKIFSGSWIPNICIKKGTYSKILTFSTPHNGFYISHVRCCRANFTNIRYNQGIHLSQYIPPSHILNNSPSITYPQVVVCCAESPIQNDLQVTDKDGDSLVFSFEVPNAGGSDVDPIPTPPANYSDPILSIYEQNYSLQQAFGLNGSIIINPINGSINAYNPNPGIYALSIGVREFRNGELISYGKYDIGLYTLICPPSGLMNNSETEIKIYPNPTNGSNLIIDFGKVIQDKTTLEIFNLVGQKVHLQEINKNVSKVKINDISHLQNGIYIVQISYGDRIQSVKLEIIK